uniref:Secreted protein n=1 Tax=Rhabditophanes sp. KR3021 TaxID=114890 RepID=A0AC35U165_9BILA
MVTTIPTICTFFFNYVKTTRLGFNIGTIEYKTSLLQDRTSSVETRPVQYGDIAIKTLKLTVRKTTKLGFNIGTVEYKNITFTG